MLTLGNMVNQALEALKSNTLPGSIAFDGDIPKNPERLVINSSKIMNYCDNDQLYYMTSSGIKEFISMTPETDIYLPAYSDKLPFMYFKWDGFQATSEELGAAGWQYKCLKNPFTNKYLFRFFNPSDNMTFSIKSDTIHYNLLSYSLHHITMSSGGKLKRKSWVLKLNEFTTAHIPQLLDIILELQKPSYKKRIKDMELPEADIIELGKVYEEPITRLARSS